MSENNGKMAWIRYLVGILVTLILLVALPMLVNSVIANDISSRERDAELIKNDVNLREQLHSCVKEQMLTNQQILIALAEIKAEIKK